MSQVGGQSRMWKVEQNSHPKESPMKIQRRREGWAECRTAVAFIFPKSNDRFIPPLFGGSPAPTPFVSKCDSCRHCHDCLLCYHGGESKSKRKHTFLRIASQSSLPRLIWISHIFFYSYFFYLPS